jgi:hypothetical protein
MTVEINPQKKLYYILTLRFKFQVVACDKIKDLLYYHFLEDRVF